MFLAGGSIVEWLIKCNVTSNTVEKSALSLLPVTFNFTGKQYCSCLPTTCIPFVPFYGCRWWMANTLSTAISLTQNFSTNTISSMCGGSGTKPWTGLKRSWRMQYLLNSSSWTRSDFLSQHCHPLTSPCDILSSLMLVGGIVAWFLIACLKVFGQLRFEDWCKLRFYLFFGFYFSFFNEWYV